MISGPELHRSPGSPGAYLLRLGEFVLIGWGVYSEVRPGLSGAHLAAWVLLFLALPTWLLVAASSQGTNRLRRGATFSLAVVGGAMVPMAAVGLVFVGAAAVGFASELDLPLLAVPVTSAPLATLVAVALRSASYTNLVYTGAVTLGGVLLGLSRRQAAERVQYAAELQVEQERVQVEHERAAVLEERNRLAREVHDVLAHTLGALSVQLEALDAQLAGLPDAPPAVRDGVARTKALASDGLVEARRAVKALRDDVEPISDQLVKLCDLRSASLAVTGEVRPLTPEATLALYRVAQESLTNASKHAPGAPVGVELRFGPATVRLAVANGPGDVAPGELAASGGGYGIDGIRERVRLLGGSVTTGPRDGGWRVDAEVPA